MSCPREGTAPPLGWHRADIKAALEKRGLNLSSLSRAHGYSSQACSRALRVQWPQVERIIADALELEPLELWPDRYHADGSPVGNRFWDKRAKRPYRYQRRAAAENKGVA